MFAQNPTMTSQDQPATETAVSTEHFLINGVISLEGRKRGAGRRGAGGGDYGSHEMEVPVLAHQSGVIQLMVQQGVTCHTSILLIDLLKK